MKDELSYTTIEVEIELTTIKPDCVKTGTVELNFFGRGAQDLGYPKRLSEDFMIFIYDPVVLKEPGFIVIHIGLGYFKRNGCYCGLLE